MSKLNRREREEVKSGVVFLKRKQMQTNYLSLNTDLCLELTLIFCLSTQNQELSTMHASKAFMDFINKKTVRKPEVRTTVIVCWSQAVAVVM